jgi:hypothetical protein
VRGNEVREEVEEGEPHFQPPPVLSLPRKASKHPLATSYSLIRPSPSTAASPVSLLAFPAPLPQLPFPQRVPRSHSILERGEQLEGVQHQ